MMLCCVDLCLDDDVHEKYLIKSGPLEGSDEVKPRDGGWWLDVAVLSCLVLG